MAAFATTAAFTADCSFRPLLQTSGSACSSSCQPVHLRPPAILAKSFFGRQSFGRKFQSASAQPEFESQVTKMHLGTPKVPYKGPGETRRQFIDIYNRLYKERVIFVGKQIDDEMANQIISVMLFLDSENQRDIQILINSKGGYVTSGLAIYDTSKHVKSDICTACVGHASSMASFLLSGGTKGKRFALRYSRIMIHQPRGGASGEAADALAERDQINRVRDMLYEMYSEQTGQPVEKLEQDMRRDFFMSAFEAKDYGLIDKVVLPRRKANLLERY
mmetsp:Transcript_22433/g.38501  ORF Transcript_22433/g.38501 Transcript_22433/m.38501 type:complete len:276 (+) Transcript_22433:44-871(+)